METQDIINHFKSSNYIVSDSEYNLTMHESIRAISRFYELSHTTISKSLNENICTCKTKKYGVIVIMKLNNDSN